MADGFERLRKAQIGIESPKGTAVPATAVLLPIVTMENTPEFFRPKEERGSLAPYHRTVKVADLAALTMSGDVTFEQILYALHMGVLGGVSPSTVDTSGKLWVFTPTLTGTTTLGSFTIEHGDNVQAFEVEYCMASKIEFMFAMNGPVTFKADLFGRQMLTCAFTGALAAPTVETALGQKTKIYVDAVAGTMGATALAASLVSATFTINTGLYPKRYGDGATVFSAHGEGEKTASLKATLYFHTDANTERANFGAGVQRLVRLKTEGSLVGAVSALKFLQLDLCGVWTKWGPLGTVDGYDVVEVEMECEKNSSTWAKLFEVSVQNGVATLP